MNFAPISQSQIKRINVASIYLLNMIVVISSGILMSLVPLVNSLEDDELSYLLAATALGRLQIVEHSLVEIFLFPIIPTLFCCGVNKLAGIENGKYVGKTNIRRTALFTWIGLVLSGLVGCLGFLHQIPPFGIPSR